MMAPPLMVPSASMAAQPPSLSCSRCGGGACSLHACVIRGWSGFKASPAPSPAPHYLQTCIQAIRDHGFKASSPFPVIITLENHTDAKNQVGPSSC